MRKLLIFLNFLFVIVMLSSVGTAAEICDDASTIGLADQSRKLWRANCVAECSQVLNKKSADDLKFFEQKCAESDAEKQKKLKWDDIQKTFALADEVASQCLTLGLKKGVMAPVELAMAVPGLVRYLLSGAWTKNFSGEVSVAYDLCKDNPDCRRGVARNTVRFNEKNPDGTYRIADADVDKQIASQHFMDLQIQATHDIPLIENECMGYLGSLRRNMASDGEDWTEARHKKVKDTLAQQYPHCPEFLKLNEIRQAKPEKDPKEEQDCLAREKEHPEKCLSLYQQIRIGLQCLGGEFRRGLPGSFKEACSDGLAVLVPLPGITEAKVAFAAAKGIVRKEAVTAATEVSQLVRAIDGPAASLTASVETRVLTPAQKTFVSSYRNKVYVDQSQNQRYINFAQDPAKEVAENKTRYFIDENSTMKKMNDATNDKELVTSITNYRKELVSEGLEDLRKKYPDVKFAIEETAATKGLDEYSDFKSFHIRFESTKQIDEATHNRILADLNKLYGQSGKDLAAKMKELKIEIPEAGDPDQWFKAGYGRNVEEAAAAARQARQNGATGVVDYTSVEVQTSMRKSLGAAEEKRQALASSNTFAPLMEKTTSGLKLPKEDVFDLVRKNDSPEALAKAISLKYDLKSFAPEDAVKLQDYAKSVDEFSPTILIPKRETVDLDDAFQGGLSADFLGMGSANMRATAEGIAGKTSVETALIGAREGEKKVTQTFKQRMEAFKKVVGDAKCTGDDCAMAKLLSDNEKSALMNKLARNPETRGVRMSFIGPNVTKDTRMQLASHGESIEKVFRKELAGKIPAAKLDKMTLGFDMKSTKLGQGNVNLVIGKGRGTSITAKEQIEMQQAFARAVEKINKAKGATYTQGAGTFTKQKIFWVPGVHVLGLEDNNEP